MVIPMKTDDLSPPSITKKNNSIKELVGILVLMGRDKAERELEIGKRLCELRERCVAEQKDWLPVLAETRYSRSAAGRYMRAFIKHKSGAQCAELAHMGPDEWIDSLAGKEPEESTDGAETADGGAVSPAPSDTNGFDSSSPPATTSPPAETVFCRDCRINGPKKKCKECASLRGKDDPLPRPKGDPVADAQAKDKALPKPGDAKYTMKDLTPAYGQLARQVDALYKSYGLVNKRGEVSEDERYKKLVHLLKEFHREAKALISDLSKQPTPEAA